MFSFGMTFHEGCRPPGKSREDRNKNDQESRKYDLQERWKEQTVYF